MPACFTLTLKGQDVPMKLPEIDDMICAHLGIEPHPENFCYEWVDIIGFYLALGKDWDWIDNELGPESKRYPILQYLRENFEPNAWYQRR